MKKELQIKSLRTSSAFDIDIFIKTKLIYMYKAKIMSISLLIKILFYI